MAVQLEGALPAAGWTLRGRVHNPYALAPCAVEFAETIVRGLPPPTRQVRIASHVRLKSLSAQSERNALDVSTTRGETIPEEYLCTLTPAEELPLGRFRALVFLEGVTHDGIRLPPIPFPVAGTVVADVRAVPREVTFVVALPGSSNQQTLIVRSASGRRFAIDGVTSTDETVRITPAASPLSDSHAFVVSIEPGETGEHRDEVRFAVVDEQGDRSEIEAEVYRYYLSVDAAEGSPDVGLP
jgi:hypothetical protein